MADTFINFRRVRIFAEKINDTFHFFKQNFKSLIKVLSAIYLPFALLFFGIVFGMQYNIVQGGQNPEAMGIGFSLSVMASGVLMMMLFHGIVGEYMKIYQETGGEQPDINTVFNNLMGDFGRLLGAYLLMTVVVFFSLFFFLIPGIYFMVVFSFSFMVIVWEKCSPGGAVTRCLELIQGHWWKTFGLILIFVIIQWFLVGMLEAPFMIWMGVVSWHSVDLLITGEMDVVNSIIAMIFGLIYAIAGILIQSIMTIGMGIHYFSILEEKEAPALMEEVDRFGKEGQVQ